MYVSNLVNILGKRAIPIVTSAAYAQTDMLETGIYDVYVSVDTFIRVANFKAESPDRAQDVTVTNGYRIAAGNTIPVFVPTGCRIGAIAAGAGAMILHRID